MFLPRRSGQYLLALALTFSVQLNSYAAASVEQDVEDPRPGLGAMIGDAMIARPLLLATTALGTAAFVVSLPFTIMGGKVKEAADTLIVKPADETFLRCLGCTPVQNKYKNDPFAQSQPTEQPE